MEYKRFSEAQVGTVIKRPALVSQISENMTKTGDKFCKVTLQDGENSVVALMFNTDKTMLEEDGIFECTVVDSEVAVSDYRGTKSFKIIRLSACQNQDDISKFIKMPPIDCEVMFQGIIDMLRASSGARTNMSLADFTIAMLTERHDDFIHSSAAVSMHHNLKGGLVYHTYRMMQTAQKICDVYTELDKELLLCATALHDIGKIQEYNTSMVGEAKRTPDGVLFGHLIIGIVEIEKMQEKLQCADTERIRLLEHMIAAHHGTNEWGTIMPPAIPEAFVLHYIDNMDAKIYMYNNLTADIPAGEVTEQKPFGLDNRLYKPIR